MTGAVALSASLASVPEQRLSPAHVQRLAQFMTLVHATALELDAVVDAGLRDNPMLQRASGSPCRCCGRHCGTGLCHSCARLRLPDDAPTAAPAWREELAAAVRLELPPPLRSLADAVVGSLDDDGLLRSLPGEDPPQEDLARVLEALRAVGPPGIAARSRVECVAAQARALVAAGRAPDLVVQLLEHHADALADGDLDGPADDLGVGREAVVAALEALRSCASPAALVEEARTRPAPPDVVYAVEPGTGRLTATVTDAAWFGLGVDDQLWTSVDGSARAWLRPYRRQALDLLRSLDARAALLQAVALEVAEHQHGFLLAGPAEHRPLSRARVAETLGVHPSTVARAVIGKVARCPDGRLVPLAACFGASTAAVEALRGLLADHPDASDAELAALLARRGHRVARRTVAKYRHELTGPRRPSRRRAERSAGGAVLRTGVR